MDQTTASLGAFVLEALIGTGGMGRVWRGRHALHAVPVALKVLPRRDELKRRRFGREVQALAGLSHPNIITVFDHGVVSEEAAQRSDGALEAGSLYLVMELASGSLQEASPPRDWIALRGILMALLRALAHAHARGVVHRDIKPGNVLVTREPGGAQRLKLTDFGIAFALDDQDARQDEDVRVAGSVRFMAPEQLLGRWRDQGPWTDLYALGCMAYQLATGHPPFGEPQSQVQEVAQLHLRHPPPPPETRFPTPLGFERWLMTLLAKTPEQRFRFAADAMSALRALDAPVVPEVGVGVFTSAPRTASAPAFPPWPAEHTAAIAAPPGVGLGLHGLRTIPVLGREAEKEALWGALREVCEARQARTVVLHGAAGMGKSRLTQWLCRQAHELGLAQRVRAQHDRDQGPHTGLRGLVEEQLQLEGMTCEQALGRAKLLMRRRGVQEPYWWLSLAAIACPDPSQQATGVASGFRFRDDQERYQAVGFLLRELCRERPVIAWFDDVQWGADALRFVRFMLRAQADDPCPVLFVLTRRDSDQPLSRDCAASMEAIQGAPGALEVRLGPLPPEAQRQLIGALLKLDDAFVVRAAQRTEGNPLFAIQIVDDLVQRGLLKPSERGFALAEEARELPEDMDALWERRLSQTLAGCEAEPWLAMELAATLGPQVRDVEWRAVCQLRAAPIPVGLIEALVKSRLARRTQTGWAFVHGLLQARLQTRAAEGGRLAEHHRLCAAMLQTRFGESGQRGVLERVGTHLERAGDRRAAARVLLRAAEERVDSGDFARAEALWERWRACVEQHDDTTPRRWARAGLVLARIQRRSGSYAEAAQTLERYPPPSDNPVPNPMLMAEHLVEQARVTSVLAMVREDQELFARTRALHDQAEALYTRLGATGGLAEAALSRAFTATMSRDWPEATTRFVEAMKLFEQVGDRLQYAVALIGLSETELQGGGVGGARRKAQRALSIFEAAGARHHICHALYSLAELDRAEGQMSRAEARYRRVLKLMEGMGSFNIQLTRHALARTLIERDAWSEAAAVLNAILTTTPEHLPPAFVHKVRVDLLAATASQRTWEAFDAHLGALSTPPEPPEADRLEQAGRLALAAGEPGRAAAALRMARDAFERLTQPHRVATIDLLLRDLRSDE